MIVKEYNIPLYRKIGTCELKNTESIRSDLYLKCNKNNNIEINKNLYKTEIYNIQHKSNSLTIYSNTTNILLTNMYLDGIPLYQKIEEIHKDLFNEVIEILKDKVTDKYLVESLGDFYTVYLNTDLLKLPNVEGLFVRNVQEIGDSTINIVSNVSIRRLKDRLKITVNVNDSEKYTFKLGSQYLLEPKYYKNWIHFYECVYLGIDQKPIHVYNHSFNFVFKTEAYDNKEYEYLNYKDPYLNLQDISEEFIDNKVFASYPSYRSNLLIPTNYSEDLYIYLNISNQSDLKTKNLIVSIKELNEATLVPVLVKKPYKVDYEVFSNNFTKTELRECNSEGYTVVQDTFVDQKYNNVNDIKLSNTRVITRLDKIVRNKENYISFNDNRNIIQENDLSAIPTKVIPTTTKQFPFEIQQRLDDLNNFIENNRNIETNFPDKFKIYYVEY